MMSGIFYIMVLVNSMKNLFNYTMILFCLMSYKDNDASDMHIKDTVIHNRKYVEEFSNSHKNEHFEYTEIAELSISSGSVSLLNITNWINNEPGDFRRVIIKKNHFNKILFDNIDGWEKVYYPNKKHLTNDYFLELNIGGSEPVLIFFGYIYASLPGWLTIISLQGPKPEIIFNKELSLAKIVPNGDSYKLIICNDKHFIEDYYEEKHIKGKLISRKPKVKNPYKFCSEIYIENNELKIVPCTRTLEDDRKEELEEKKKTNLAN